MKATKDYGPCTTCDKPIKKGDEFVIVGGEFYHATCKAGDALDISSRKIEPPSAAENLPGLSFTAPVKAPLIWPKSSLSSNVSGIAPQLTSTKGSFRRLEC